MFLRGRVLMVSQNVRGYGFLRSYMRRSVIRSMRQLRKPMINPKRPEDNIVLDKMARGLVAENLYG